MEKLRLELVRKRNFFSIVGLLGIIVAATIGYWGYSQVGLDSHRLDFIHGAQAGLFSGFVLIILMEVMKINKGLKDDKSFKKLEIELSDERNILIKDKIGGLGFELIIFVLMIAIVVAGFFNEIVFFTLLGVLLFIVATKSILKFYYSKKY